MLGLRTMLYLAPTKVVSDSTESSVPKMEHETNPIAGIIGLASFSDRCSDLRYEAASRRTRDETRFQIEANIPLFWPPFVFLIDVLSRPNRMNFNDRFY